MGEIIKDAARGLPLYQYIVIFVLLALGIAGFVVPPVGEINPSVLKFVALMGAIVWGLSISNNLPKYIEAGAKIRASHGDTTIEVSGKE